MRLFFILLTCLFSSIHAIDTLTEIQAIEIGLANNYAIKIAKNSTTKANNLKKLKIGSLLPFPRADASIEYSNTKSSTDGTSNTIPSLTSTDRKETKYQLGTSLNWTLFDGCKMFYSLKQLDQNIQLTKQTSRHEIESAVVKIVTSFYNLKSARTLFQVAREQLNLSRVQLKRLKTKIEFGGSTNRALLRQKVIVNEDSSMVATRKLEETKALHELNLALGNSPEDSLEIVADSLITPPKEDAQFWYKNAKIHNAGLNIFQIQKNIAYSELKIARASFWPTISATGSYAKTWGETDLSRFSTGLALSWPLFSGFRTLTTLQNAQIDTKNAEFSLAQKQATLHAYIYQQWHLLTNAYSQLNFEKEAIALAQQLLAYSKEQYTLGQITDVQFRESQLSLLNTQARLEIALFQYKITSIQLLQLAGMLGFKML